MTHTLWALHETGLDIWFKGGTSLSKGFGLIQRFSEDLDMMILPGAVAGLPEVTNWTSTNKGPVAQRQTFYDALTGALVVPTSASSGMIAASTNVPVVQTISAITPASGRSNWCPP